MSEDPYKLLREWVDPEAGGTLPQMYRLQILELLKERERDKRLESIYCEMHGAVALSLKCPACFQGRLVERAERAEARVKELEAMLGVQAFQKLMAENEALRAKLASVELAAEQYKSQRDFFERDHDALFKQNEALRAELDHLKANNRYQAGYAAGEKSMRAEYAALWAEGDRKMLEAERDRLRKAAHALYYAAHWTADRPVNAVALWTALRDAAGFTPGNAPRALASEEENR